MRNYKCEIIDTFLKSGDDIAKMNFLESALR